ncbi:MAG: hypothetical protein EB051_05105, partial [Chlamydiia bacterium]|nr:hypothetical protein [Chlamydiia bacterium]
SFIAKKNSSKFNFFLPLIGLGAVCGCGFALTKKYPAIKCAASSLYQNFVSYLFRAPTQLLGPSKPNHDPSEIEALRNHESSLAAAVQADPVAIQPDQSEESGGGEGSHSGLSQAPLETEAVKNPQEDLCRLLGQALSKWIDNSSSNEEKAIRLENQKSISDAYLLKTLYLKGDLTQLPSIVWQQPFIARLESLKLLGCNLASIPKEIALANNLKYFTIEGSKLSEFPAGLISKLDKLTLFQVKNDLDVDKVDFYKYRSILENPRRGDSLSVGWNQQNATYLYTKGARVAIHA